MGQRHNRRRTRPRSSHRSNLNQDISSPVNQSASPSGSPLAVPASIWSSTNFIEPPSPTTCISRGSPGPAPAPTWHYGCTAWQIRDAAPRLETEGFEAEQYRLFGGEPGDDVTLCYRMLEYFGGLDYIDSARPNTLGD